MIASLAATGLATGLGGSTGGSSPPPPEDESPVPEETPTGLLTFDAPEDANLDISKVYQAVITTDQGEIIIALNRDAPQAVNSFAFLAGQDFYDGLEFFWVKSGFTAQTGDPTCESSGRFSCTGTGGPGYTLLKEGNTSEADKWTVIAPATSPGSDRVHGSQFLIALDELEFEGSIIGHVVEGHGILESLGERVPCFPLQPRESCQTEDELEELPPALIIEDIDIQPA